MAYNRQHRAKDATQEFQEAVNFDPNNADARYLLALAKFAIGDKKGAMEQYDPLKSLNAQYADDLNKKLNQ
jgi:cytochrome c-type biogenesis protein CcmH/NrfG